MTAADQVPVPGSGRPLADSVAVITGGASGIGAAVARRLAAEGTGIVVADVDDVAGGALADELGGRFVHCDVREPQQNQAVVDAAVEHFGGLDILFLNAGVTTGCSLGDDFDVEAYRRAMAINLDGVVFGIHAALPAMRARGGGTIVATASMAGLTPVPDDPVYSANKHAVIGLMRSMGPVLARDRIRSHALCPWFVDTPILGGIRGWLDRLGLPILATDDVVDAFLRLLASDSTGDAWPVLPDTEAEPISFVPPPGWPGVE